MTLTPDPNSNPIPNPNPNPNPDPNPNPKPDNKQVVLSDVETGEALRRLRHLDEVTPAPDSNS